MKSRIHVVLNRIVLGFLACLILLAVYPEGALAQAPPVPPSYQDLYTQLQNYLDNYNATLSANGNVPPYPTILSAALETADANEGPQLINGAYENGVQNQLQELKAMGVQGVFVELGFPMLYEPFFSSHSDYQQYVDFYAHVATTVKALNMKLIVLNNILWPTGSAGADWDTTDFFAGLSWDQYQQARAQTAAVIAQTMQPDYLVLLEEPDAEAGTSGQTQIGTPSGAAALVSQMITAVQNTGVPGIQLGAGAGTWQYELPQFIQAFVALPLNFIDTQIYNVNGNYLPNALMVANMAASAGLPVTMSACWLHKVRDSELDTLTNDQIRARNPFDFWAPLDSYFVQTMETMASYTHMSFLSLYGSHYLFAYVPYNDTTESMTPEQIMNMEIQQVGQANNQAIVSPSGMSYYSSLVSPADTVPPSAPTHVTGVSGNPTSGTISWNASTDNVGVAGYYIFRNGLNVAQTALTSYQDSGLTEANTYTYTIQAFDLGGNLSAPSQTAQITTKDVTPPSPPSNLAGAPVSCQKISLTWSPSIDNGGIRAYRVFWGTSSDSLVQIGSTKGTSFNSSQLSPSTTYYYGVQVQDTSGNLSNMSQIVPVTTFALPTPPASFSATAVSASQINLVWSGAGGGLPIARYYIYAGATPSSLSQMAMTTGSSFSVRSLTAGTTYYYALQAVDSAGDASPLSSVISATTLSLPTAPVLTATTLSDMQISLSWSTSTGSLPITKYIILRGGSSSNLTQLATRPAGPYADKSVTTGNTYYYALEAVDSANDVSPMSAVVSATATVSLSAPDGLAATPSSATQIGLTWSPASGTLSITKYYVFAGINPSTMPLVATAKTTSYAHRSLDPSTTYYYAVEAVDTAGDVSPMSAVASATTLALPSTPNILSANAVSSVKVTLTWSASTGSLPISKYLVYRGSSPSNMSQVGSRTTTSYNDALVAPGTTYYYAIVAEDSAGDLSAMSEATSVTTPN